MISKAMRNLACRVGPKASFYHLLGMVPNSGAAAAMLQNIPVAIYYVFATLAPQKHAKRSILAIFGITMTATPQFGVKIGSHLAPCKRYLKPDDARGGYKEPTMSTESTFKVPRSLQL